MQSKRLSAIEAIINAVVGLVTAYLTQLVVYPALGIAVSYGQNLLITAVFFLVSIARSFVLRRLFNRRELLTDSDRGPVELNALSGEALTKH